MRRRKQQSNADNGSERRVAISVDTDAQELVVAGSENDVEQVAGELEYVRSTRPQAFRSDLCVVPGYRHYTREPFWRPAYNK